MEHRFLFVLTEIEWETFFPDRSRREVVSFADDSLEVDPTGLSAESWRTLLRDFRPTVIIAAWKTPSIPEDFVSLTGGSLEYVCYLAGSVRKLVSEQILETGLTVTNWGGVISRTVAEEGLMLTIAALRRANYWALSMHNEGAWKTPATKFYSLFERRVGIHGFGNIARELVRLLKPFDCKISAFSPNVPEALFEEHGVTRSDSLDDLFGGNDIVVELAALTPETRGIVREEHLRRMPEGGVFINIGRGAVVDEDALARLALEGRIQVGLDVYGEEPLPKDSPFRGCKNVMLMPHLGGPTTDRRQDSGRLAISNIRRYLAGEPLEAVVTGEVFSRAS